MKTILLILLTTVSLTTKIFSSNRDLGGYTNDTAKRIYSNGFLVHGRFEFLFTQPEYKCLGLKAVCDYEACFCNFCRKIYYLQRFEDKEGNVINIYTDDECNSSHTGYHDDLDFGKIVVPPPIYFIK